MSEIHHTKVIFKSKYKDSKPPFLLCEFHVVIHVKDGDINKKSQYWANMVLSLDHLKSLPSHSLQTGNQQCLHQHSLRNWLFQMSSICYDLKRRHRSLCPLKEQEKEFYTREIFTLDQRQRTRKPGGADCIASGLPPKHPLNSKREEPNYKFHESTS